MELAYGLWGSGCRFTQSYGHFNGRLGSFVRPLRAVIDLRNEEWLSEDCWCLACRAEALSLDCSFHLRLQPRCWWRLPGLHHSILAGFLHLFMGFNELYWASGGPTSLDQAF